MGEAVTLSRVACWAVLAVTLSLEETCRESEPSWGMQFGAYCGGLRPIYGLTSIRNPQSFASMRLNENPRSLPWNWWKLSVCHASCMTLDETSQDNRRSTASTGANRPALHGPPGLP